MDNSKRQLAADQFIRYSRQIMLEGWGEQTQTDLAQRSVVIVGGGGLGNIVASYLAGAGVGKISIIDGDEVELSNLPRQIAFDLDSIENAKVYELVNRLREQNGHIELTAHHEYISDDNAIRLLNGCDLVLDCTDNIKTRHLINRHCVTQKLVLLSASVAAWQGQLMLIDPGQPQFGCYHCLFPLPEKSLSELAATVPAVPAEENSCRTLGVAGPVVGVLGSMQATQALRFLIAAPCELAGKFLCVDGTDLSVQSFSRAKNSQCRVCSLSVNDSGNGRENVEQHHE